METLTRRSNISAHKDFHLDPQTNRCICPAGKSLYSNGRHCTVNGRTHHKFTGALRDCGPCQLRPQCLRTPEKTPVRQVAVFHQNQASPLRFTLRGLAKVNTQWHLYCLVHNIEKLAHHGYAQ